MCISCVTRQSKRLSHTHNLLRIFFYIIGLEKPKRSPTESQPTPIASTTSVPPRPKTPSSLASHTQEARRETAFVFVHTGYSISVRNGKQQKRSPSPLSPCSPPLPTRPGHRPPQSFMCPCTAHAASCRASLDTRTDESDTPNQSWCGDRARRMGTPSPARGSSRPKPNGPTQATSQV